MLYALEFTKSGENARQHKILKEFSKDLHEAKRYCTSRMKGLYDAVKINGVISKDGKRFLYPICSKQSDNKWKYN